MTLPRRILVNMTIGEILLEFLNITSQPNVSVSILQSRISSDQHFSILLDSDGIIGADGNAIKTTSNASYAPPHDESQLQVLFDTGFHRHVVNSIYFGASGVQLVSDSSLGGDICN